MLALEAFIADPLRPRGQERTLNLAAVCRLIARVRELEATYAARFSEKALKDRIAALEAEFKQYVADTTATVGGLLAEKSRLEADKARLDWLDATHYSILPAASDSGMWYLYDDAKLVTYGANIRQMLDGGIAAQNHSSHK